MALWLGCLLASAHSRPLALPSPSDIQCGEAALPARQAPAALELPFAFSDSSERAYWDIPLDTALPRDATTLEVTLTCTNMAPVRGLSLHLASGKGWYGITVPFGGGVSQAVSLPVSGFQPEGEPGPWRASRTLRLSVWCAHPGAATLILHSLATRVDATAIMRSTELTAPGETALAAAQAARCERLLSKARIPFTVMEDNQPIAKNLRLLILPYNPRLPPRLLKQIHRFIRSKGRVIVFYNGCVALATPLGIKLSPWQATPADEPWTAMACLSTPLDSSKLVVPHSTGNIIPPHPLPQGEAFTVAEWVDAHGYPTDLPACVTSPQGAWFAHLPPLAYPSAVQLMRSIVLYLDPTMAPPPEETRNRAALLPATVTDEIRAVWQPRAAPAHRRGWPALIPELANHRINNLFVLWQSAATLHWKKKPRRPQDSFEAALKNAREHGLKLHAWVTCWTLDGADPQLRRQLADERRLMMDANGNSLDWLCPSIPENRALLLRSIRETATSGVDGVHLDYMRYPGAQGCYAPATRRAFESFSRRPVETWPRDVLPGGARHDDFNAFRCHTMTSFMREVRAAVRRVAPDIQLSCALFATPRTAASCGQQWPLWLESDLLDFGAPMLYSESPPQFEAWLDACLDAAAANRLVVGLGSGADETQLDTPSLAAQLHTLRAHKTRGFALYALDQELLSIHLPRLFPLNPSF